MKEKKQLIFVRLSDSDYKRISDFAKEYGFTIAGLARYAILKLLREEEQKSKQKEG